MQSEEIRNASSFIDWMACAHEMARAAGNDCTPNPRVGCVLVSADGRLIGKGHTQRVGGPHAEVMALRDASSLGHSTVGATAYVTLEPCSHQGRTGPCCDALVTAGVKKVVASVLDPNPKVSGMGFDRLRAAGVQVEVGSRATESYELNIGFFRRMTHGLPWVRMKVAASLDGHTALQNGSSQWITSEAARTDGHAWRARSCAILSGIGTVLADNPRLDVRLVESKRQPHVVVVDSRLETPADAQLFVPGRSVYIYTAVNHPARKAALEARGATVVSCPNQQGKVDLVALMHDLAAREINEVHVEAGATLNGALMDAGLVDEALIYFAPKWLGSGMGMAQIQAVTNLAAVTPMDFQSVDRIGPDVRILARMQGSGHP